MALAQQVRPQFRLHNQNRRWSQRSQNASHNPIKIKRKVENRRCVFEGPLGDLLTRHSSRRYSQAVKGKALAERLYQRLCRFCLANRNTVKPNQGCVTIVLDLNAAQSLSQSGHILAGAQSINCKSWQENYEAEREQ